MAHRTHGSLAIHQAVGPVSFLVVSAALGVALTLTTLYTPSYAVTVDGAPVGVVADGTWWTGHCRCRGPGLLPAEL